MKPNIHKFIQSIVIITIILVPSIVYAQTRQIVWDQSNVTSPTAAQSLEYRLYITPPGQTNPSTTVLLTSVLCGGTAPVVNCSTVLPATASSATITGTKSELTAKDIQSGLESTKSNPFFMGAAAPTNLKIIP